MPVLVRAGQAWRPVLLGVGLAGMLSGCAKFTEDGGMGRVAIATTEALGKDVRRIRDEHDAAEVEGRVRGLLFGTLTADKAVQVALLSNRGLQAAFAELAVTEAEQVEAGLPPSPTISLARSTATIASGAAYGSILELERQVLTNVLALLTLPRRREIAEHRFKQAQLKAIEAVLRTAVETRRTYYRAVAAAQTVQFLEEAKESAAAASEIAKRLGESGALNKLQQAREHAFYADLGAQLATAKLRKGAAQEQLVRAMGLWGRDRQIKLPSRLPDLPKSIKPLKDVEAEAVEKRIDIHIAKAELDILAKSYGLTKHTRFLNVLEVRGWRIDEREKVITPDPPNPPDVERTRVRWSGLELEFQIPIWDLGEARTRRAEETYLQAVHRLAERAINARSEVREAYGGYRGTYDIAKLYQKDVLPLRRIISEETMLHYNAMIADLSVLLADARARVLSNIAAIDAQRDFYLAKADLQAAILGGGAGGGGGGETSRVAAAGGGEGAGH